MATQEAADTDSPEQTDDDSTPDDAPSAESAAPEQPAAAPDSAPDSPAAPQQAPDQAVSPDNTIDVIGQKPPLADELKAQDAAWQQDLANGHIKPETYSDLFAKKDTLGKIGTLFGLLVGGAGSGLSHQPNALLAMMQKEIDNDMDAQKQSKANAQNFLRLNQQHQMNQATITKMGQEGAQAEAHTRAMDTESKIKAYSLARIQTNSAALHNLTLNVNKMPLGSPQRAEAEKQLAILSNGVQNENFSIADRAQAASALANASMPPEQGSGASSERTFQGNQTALRVGGNAPLAEANEAKHMPGVKGQASVPLTSDDRGKILNGTQFQGQLQRFMDWTKKHSGDLYPKDKAEGEALAAQLQGSFRQATNGGVYKEGEQGFISKVIDSTPTKFFNKIRVLPKLQAVQQESRAQLDSMLKAKGFDGYEPPHPNEGKVAYDAKGNGMVMKNGKWVPTGKTKQATK